MWAPDLNTPANKSDRMIIDTTKIFLSIVLPSEGT